VSAFFRTILHQGAATSPELRADVRDQILLVISEPVYQRRYGSQMQGADSHDGEEDGTWSRTCELS
jgi:hypothetical protein